jgi:uncharacterized membrane protein YeiH
VRGEGGTDFSSVLLVIDLVGVFVFSLSGALVAVRKQLDIFGLLVLAFTTGLGGGMIRDVLIGDAPPAALRDWRFLVAAALAGLVAFVYHPALGRMEKFIGVFDAIGLALFTVAGAVKAIDYGVPDAAAALLGMVTGIGGGMLRDVLAGRVPVVLQRGELYAIPSLAGAAVTVGGLELGLSTLVVSIVGGLVCGVWRLLAMWRHWQAPMPQGPASV